VSCEFAHLDASYVLGALSPAEQAQYARHLAACVDCSRAVAELAPLPLLLARAGALAAQPIDPGPPPDTLLPTLVRQARRSVRRRMAGTAVAASVVGAALAGSAITIIRQGPTRASSAASTPAATPSSSRTPSRTLTAGTGPITADLAMTTVLWGTRLDLTCTYTPDGQADAADEVYLLVVRTRDGDVQQVGSWHAVPGRTMRVATATAMRADDIAAVEVREADGVVVATLSG